MGQGRPKVPARTGSAPPPPHPWVSPVSRPRSPSEVQALSLALARPRSGALPAPPLGLESRTELSRRKGLAEGGWMTGWVTGWVG